LEGATKLWTVSNKRLLSTSESSNDEESSNQHSDDNEIPEDHSMHGKGDDHCTHASETENKDSNDNASNPILAQSSSDNQNQENHTSCRRPLPTAANRRIENAEQTTTNDKSYEDSDDSQGSSNSDGVPQNCLCQESQRVIDMRKKLRTMSKRRTRKDCQSHQSCHR